MSNGGGWRGAGNETGKASDRADSRLGNRREGVSAGTRGAQSKGIRLWIAFLSRRVKWTQGLDESVLEHGEVKSLPHFWGRPKYKCNTAVGAPGALLGAHASASPEVSKLIVNLRLISGMGLWKLVCHNQTEAAPG